jgi:thymidylate synthase (FAD)
MRIVKPSFTVESTLDGAAVLRAIERYGRTCYKSEAKATSTNAGEFVRKLIASGHESAIEHESVTVRIVCDRGVSHEIVRHRLASYSQESTRYCDYAGGEVTFVLPCWLTDDEYSPHYNYWGAAMKLAESAYKQLRAWGWTSQEARCVLPNSLKTELVMTCNLREWRHFFKMRTSPAAHPQMREIAIPMLVEFKRLIPVVFDDILVQEPPK